MTLELGGKCPAILTDDSVDAESVKQVLGTKALKNGQMCISVDYCLVPRGALEDFARLAAEHVRETCPATAHRTATPASSRAATSSGSRTCSRTPRPRGCDVRPLEEGGDADPGARQLPMSIVLDPPG